MRFCCLPHLAKNSMFGKIYVFVIGGGENVEVLTRRKFKDSYFGCVGNVYIENREVFLQDMADDGRNIHPCTEDSI